MVDLMQIFQIFSDRWRSRKILSIAITSFTLAVRGVQGIMGTLFSPKKRIIQEGDLAIIWIVHSLPPSTLTNRADAIFSP